MSIRDWKFQPPRIYVHPDDYRDMLLDMLRAEGWADDEARREADRIVAQMLPPQGAVDPAVLEMAKRVEAGEG